MDNVNGMDINDSEDSDESGGEKETRTAASEPGATKTNTESDFLNDPENSVVLCLPGQRLCLSDDTTVAGRGTYERQGYINANLAGIVQVKEEGNCKLIEVNCIGNQIVVPVPGDIVTARVTQVNQRFAKCAIICVRDYIVERKYKAILRKEDIRSTEKDRVEIYKSFRPGDIILARVLPQVELSCFQLSTAENELGVVVAVCSESGANGVPMVPVGWTEMQCPNTLIKEPRKVARVAPESTVLVDEDVEKERES